MIVITGAMMASAAIAGGGSALSAFGNYQKNRAALKRANKQAEKLEFQDARDFMSNVGAYKDYVDSELEAYAMDIKNLVETYELNGRARQRSIEAGLTQLADISDGFIQKAFSRKTRLAEATGKPAASGMTGVTAERFDRVQRGQAAKNTGMDVESMNRAVGAFMFRDQGAALQQEYANKNAFNRVRPPKFGPAPAAPQARARMADYSGRDLAFGLAKAGFDAVGAGLAKAPETPFQDPTGGPTSLPPAPLSQLSFGGNRFQLGGLPVNQGQWYGASPGVYGMPGIGIAPTGGHLNNMMGINPWGMGY